MKIKTKIRKSEKANSFKIKKEIVVNRKIKKSKIEKTKSQKFISMRKKIRKKKKLRKSKY